MESSINHNALRLKSEMTLLNGITVIVGCIIGSGIFVSPTGVLVSTGSVNLSLVIWAVCGIYVMFGAYCYAELGCMITKSGADYAYIHVAFGPLMAFIRLWSECVIVRPCTAAIQSLTFALYVLKTIFPECDPPDSVIRLLAGLCLMFLCFINCYKVKWATLVQDYFTYAKLLALLVIILTGFVRIFLDGYTEFLTWTSSETDPFVIASSFYSGLFAYTGWNYLNFIIEEMKDPVKDLPKAIAISCISCVLIYVMTIIAFHSVLSVPEVLGSEAVAVTFAKRMYGRWSGFIPIFVACSTFGSANGTLLTSSRLFYAGARERQLPGVLSMISVSRLTPIPSVIIITVLALCYLTYSDILLLMNYVGFATWLSIGVAVLSLPYLRWKQPQWKRPIKVNLAVAIIYIIVTLVITILPAVSNPFETGIGAIMIMSAIPIYYMFIARSSFSCCRILLYHITSYTQKLLIVVAPVEDE